MKEILEDLLQYHLDYNLTLLRQLQEHLEVLPNRSYLLFCHVINAHEIWNARILGLTHCKGTDVHTPDVLVHKIHDNHANTLGILRTKNLEADLTYVNTQGEQYQNKISDILLHVLNHSTHHKAQIMSDFRSVGLSPMHSDYIFYKRNNTF